MELSIQHTLSMWKPQQTEYNQYLPYSVIIKTGKARHDNDNESKDKSKLF